MVRKYEELRETSQIFSIRVPPNYWELGLQAQKLGGAWGFATEISPGEAPMLLDATEYYVGADHLWPMDYYWDYHCGNQLGQ